MTTEPERRMSNFARFAALAILGAALTFIVVRWLRALDVRRARRALAQVGGKARGLRARLATGGPSPDVDDLTLADRVRSVLGPLEKRLDVPRVHVTVIDHIVTLHGSVGTTADVAALESAAGRVPGVRAVWSELHVGIGRGDTRPSDGRLAHESPMMRELVAATIAAAGIDERDARSALGATLASLVERLPAAERGHLFAHVAPDVRRLVKVPRRGAATARRVRDARAFVDLVGRRAGLDDETAAAVVNATFSAIREMIPEEASDIEAVLPSELKDLWQPAGA